MILLLSAIVCIAGGGLLALVCRHSALWSTRIAVTSTVVGGLVGLWPACRTLFGATSDPIRIPWPLPGAEFCVALDPLSAFFLVPVFLLSAIAAAYGARYLWSYRDRKSLGIAWFFFNTFVAAMALTLVARQAILFMVAWETMSLAAFFLVTFEHEKKDVRIAGWVYLVAAHIGAAALLGMFVLLGRISGSYDFADFVAAAKLSPFPATVIMILALIGFGMKAGMVPLHIWLPEAHPAAPSHVSALMSGVMIKLGLYGLLRVMLFLGTPASWWGPMLMILGLTGAIIGIATALFQRDIKRVLAYSSIENIGLILLALGLGLWGVTAARPTVAAFGFAAAFLHIWNHSLMKSLMFMGAGSVLHGTGTRDMEQLGGLLKRMPQTGAAMVLGAVAISALPPLNGFVSEWLIYLGLLHGGLEAPGGAVLLMTVGLLALVGGLAAICFVRLIGVVLLGEGRGPAAAHAHEAEAGMTVPMVILAVFCILAAVFPGALVRAFSSVITEISPATAAPFRALLDTSSALPLLGEINAVIWIAIGLVSLLYILARRRGGAAADTTWACGYAAPTPRMQYTGQSFSEMVVSRLYPKSMRPVARVKEPENLFPSPGRLATQYPDTLRRTIYQPSFEWMAARFARLRWVQQGKIQFYMLYFVVTLVAAFAWLVVRRWLIHE